MEAYRGTESASNHPSMLLSLLVYGYVSKVFSSRALERATYDSVAFCFITGSELPDHDTIAAFRKRFFDQIESLFAEVLVPAQVMGMLKLGTVALNGTKVHTKKIETQLKREVKQLPEQADAREISDGMSIPAKLERREVRLAAIATAKTKIEVR